ncbi:hypothetical protein [Nocardioides alkalitolerans]|uniref:hypothetical protein n=1 Tax=Nocardioides alkalitolerans TaxID=281714 RepID=UPI00041CF6B8|nr:hypothetical protein [Nocardioides alkalitolerans]
MTDYSPEELETVQAVVDRVSSWQDGATESTVDAELKKGFEEAGIEISEADRAKLADAIQEEHGEVSASEVLGG